MPTTPAKLPAWFEPLMCRSFGLGPRPANAPRPAPAWFVLEKQRFGTWLHWLQAGKPNPRPEILWRNPQTNRPISPGWAKDVRLRLQDAGKIPPYPPPGPVPPPIPYKPPLPTVKAPTVGKNGLYFYNLRDISGTIRRCKQYGLYAALLVNETDLTPMQDGRRPKADIWAEARALKNAGVTTVATGWAEPFGDLEAQAQFIADMFHGGGGGLYDEYMLNIEFPWVVQAGQEAWFRSDVFAPLLRQKLGKDVPLTICCDWGNEIHWLPWLQAGVAAIREQCYLNEWGHKTPADAVGRILNQGQHDLPNGIPKGIAREVVYGKYGGHEQPLSNWSSFDDAAGRPARSAWAGEFCDDADCAWLAR
jgi:hypothetical protein